MSIDPLAEEYDYNSTYAFQENKMGLGKELEGLELSKHEWLDKKGNNHIDYNASIKVVNNSKSSLTDIISMANDIANNIVNDFSGRDSDGNIVSMSVSLEFVDKVDSNSDFSMTFTDQVTKGNGKNSPAVGRTDEIGNTEVNNMQILTPGNSTGRYEPVKRKNIGNTGSHEFGHAIGLHHADDTGKKSEVRNIPLGSRNLMRRGGTSSNVNKRQLNVLNKTVKLSPNQLRQRAWNKQKAVDNKNQRAGRF